MPAPAVSFPRLAVLGLRTSPAPAPGSGTVGAAAAGIRSPAVQIRQGPSSAPEGAPVTATGGYPHWFGRAAS